MPHAESKSTHTVYQCGTTPCPPNTIVPPLEDVLPLVSPDDGNAGHGRVEVVQHGALGLVLQLARGHDALAHAHVDEDEDAGDGQEGQGEPGVDSAHHQDLGEAQQEGLEHEFRVERDVDVDWKRRK